MSIYDLQQTLLNAFVKYCVGDFGNPIMTDVITILLMEFANERNGTTA